MNVCDNCINATSESMQEYASLRNEIITLEEVQRNIWIYMYVIFCSLFVLGLQWSHYLFLVTYIVLIPFQCVFNDLWWSISKISIYIQVFFEEEYKNMNWETFQRYDIYTYYTEKKNKSIIEIVRRTGSIHLGILSTGFFCGCIIKNSYQNGILLFKIADFLLILLSIFLLVIIIIVSSKYNREDYKYCGDLEKVVREYKNKILKIKEQSKDV